MHENGTQLLFNLGRWCGGALIAPNAVLTARHCAMGSGDGAEDKEAAEWVQHTDDWINPDLSLEPYWKDYVVADMENKAHVNATVWLGCTAE